MNLQDKITSAVLAASFCILLCACGKTNYLTQDSSSEPTVSQAGEMSESGTDGESGEFEDLAGSWYIDGSKSTAHIEITKNGRFTAYYASGNVEQEGYILHETDEVEGYDTLYIYMFYSDDGEPYMGFIDPGTKRFDEFETGNGGGNRFVRVTE